MQRTAWRAMVALVVVLTAGLAVGGITAADGGQAGTALDASAQGTADVTCEFPVEVTDATGEEVTVDEEPDDVVVLGANLAQQLWAMDAQQRVSGMPIFPGSAYLEDREDYAADVSDEFGTIQNEEVVDLDPDLVLAPSIILADQVSTLRESGLTVFLSSDEQSLDDVYEDIHTTGQLVGECEAANTVVSEMQQTVDDIETATADEDPESVLYWMGGGWSAGANTVENHMISLAGGENTASEELEGYGELSEEVIVAEDPEWLLIGDTQEIPDELEPTTAIQDDQIIEVNTDFISQVGPRMVEPLTTIAESIHPEALEGTANETDDTADADDDGTLREGLVMVGAVVLGLLLQVGRVRN